MNAAAWLSLLLLAAACLAGARWSKRGGCAWVLLCIALAMAGGIVAKAGG